MKWDKLLGLVAEQPIFSAEMLRVGKAAPGAVNVQLSRWKKAGKITQLRRGVYMANPPYVKLLPGYDLYAAALLHTPSYLSLEKALEYHGLIPEGVAVYTSVTTRRPVELKTPVGRYSYRQLTRNLFWGYERLEAGGGEAFIALPEKAILDLFYLNGVNITAAYLEELRLQNLENLDLSRLAAFAGRFAGPGVKRAARKLAEYVLARGGEGKSL